ncbi:aminoacyl-tRNA hydrolase [Candidatus Dependentiae bacterium]|nr:aminoacyl-tRNA hydrolase [Candidatus Dependentiae bacterium]
MQNNIRAIIGLGNPGHKYENTRHNIGFKILDALAQKFNVSFRIKDQMEIAQAEIDDTKVYLIKPQTYMNDSGKVLPELLKKGIKPEEILVVHDELELPFGRANFKFGGSAKGHNGLKSIISVIGDKFHRFRFGIGRPQDRNEVPDYVLSNFSQQENVENLIEQNSKEIYEFVKLN